MTQTGTQMGTPVYMSPEQVRGEKSIDHRSDIYALGVTLYFTLTGKAPYESEEESSYEIFTKIINEPIPSLENNTTFDAIIQKAASKDRNARYQAVDEMRKELEASGNPKASYSHFPRQGIAETIRQAREAKESPKSVETEMETKAVLENIPTRFFNLNRLLIGVILGTLIGLSFCLIFFGMMPVFATISLALLLCIISASILFFKPSKIILRITITVFALFWLLFFPRMSYIFGAPIIIVIALFCSFMSFNKTAFVFHMLAFALLNLGLFLSYSRGSDLMGCFLLLYLCSIFVFFFNKKYFGQFIFGTICFMNLAIFYIYLFSNDYLFYSSDILFLNNFLLLILPLIELSSKLQPKVPTR
jgi:hypothetical protein